MKRTAAILVAVLAASRGKSPTAPTAPPTPAARWMLSGVVTSSPAGGPLSGVTVAILDGLDVGRTTTTDSLGRYALADLQPGGFRIQASARGYGPLGA